MYLCTVYIPPSISVKVCLHLTKKKSGDGFHRLPSLRAYFKQRREMWPTVKKGRTYTFIWPPSSATQKRASCLLNPLNNFPSELCGKIRHTMDLKGYLFAFAVLK